MIKKKTYLITGATGYIGSMLINYIVDSEPDAQITVLARNVKKAEEMLPPGINILSANLTDSVAISQLNIECDAIIHCASVTKSAEMVAHPVEVIESIVNTTQNVLELAHRCNVKSMVYLSSMEVYGNIDCSDGHRVTEAELGDIDILNVRSCYSMGKRMAENICFSYYKEYGIPVKIARLAQTFGKGVLAEDKRVFAQFARAAARGEDIILHTKGESMGNYCEIQDAISGIMTILDKGTSGEAYNVVNEENTMRIIDMAELVAERIANGRIQVVISPISNERTGYAPDTGLRLSAKKLEALGWKPQKNLVDMYQDMMSIME